MLVSESVDLCLCNYFYCMSLKLDFFSLMHTLHMDKSVLILYTTAVGV